VFGWFVIDMGLGTEGKGIKGIRDDEFWIWTRQAL